MPDDPSSETPEAAASAPVEQWRGKWEGLFPKKHPLVVLYTGNGKGKTTSALGVTMRAWGRGWNIIWLQFIKSKTSHYGETRAAERMGIEMIPLGDGFTWLSKDIEKDIALAHEAWALAREKIESGEYDLVVLDEITYPITYGWLEVEEVIQTLRDRPKDVDVILTGRDAHPDLVEFADLVTEMTEVKHPYQSGIKAQPGIDF
ncbi:MAG: cob(I)yrinic acid a,c-diamide adenosyltransferase [Dehalococcoidia bacterium]|nr:cob(I)yrinic acid a,c-diamide adenosyltransferase [Dehalococcoidia bacterium]